jgi:hypothetical protein
MPRSVVLWEGRKAVATSTETKKSARKIETINVGAMVGLPFE